jgi:glycosyltransferase involved in cell wall biosynthesis
MVTSSYPKFPGDTTAPFIEAIARGVAARGHAVDVVLPHHPDLRRGTDEPVRFFPYRYAPFDSWCLWGYAQSLESDVRVRRGVYALAPLVALSLRQRVASLLGETRYDVLHAHWLVPNAAMVQDLSRGLRVPLVVSLHGSDVFMAERFAPARVLARAALERAGAVTACSGDLSERAQRIGGSAERFTTVPYGVDIDAFSPAVDMRGVRARLGLPEGSALVLALGRLVEKKGFRYLLEAAAGLGPDVYVVIAGQGDLREPLERLARERGVRLLLPGNLERSLMAATLAAADVVVVPSVVDQAGNVDGLPNTLLEALASGRAIVASCVAGIPEVVRDGENGLLVPQQDPTALRAALARLLADGALRQRLGQAARSYAVQHLTWDAAARRFEEAYVRAAALDAC